MFHKKSNKSFKFTRKHKRALGQEKRYGLDSDKYKDKDYMPFLRAGGGLSGVIVVDSSDIYDFVKQYRKFIPNNEIYKRDKHGNIVPVYKKKR